MKGKIVNVDRYEPTKNDPNCKTYYPKDCIFGTYQIFQFLQFVVSILFISLFIIRINQKNLIRRRLQMWKQL